MKVRITDTPLLAGDYPIDFDFTHGEAHLIKKVSGLRGLEIDDGLVSGDTDLFLALGVVALERAGGVRGADQSDLIAELMRLKLGSIRLVEDEEDEGDPDPKASPPPEPNSSPSGTTTNGSSDGQETTPDVTGVPA